MVIWTLCSHLLGNNGFTSIDKNSSDPYTKSFFFWCFPRIFLFSKLHSQRAHQWSMLGVVLPLFLAPWAQRLLCTSILSSWGFAFSPMTLAVATSGHFLRFHILFILPLVFTEFDAWSPKLTWEQPQEFSLLPDPSGWCQVGGDGMQFSAFLQLSKLQFMSFNPHEGPAIKSPQIYLECWINLENKGKNSTWFQPSKGIITFYQILSPLCIFSISYLNTSLATECGD